MKAKIAKLNFLSGLYLWLNNHFVEQIMFQNTRADLVKLVRKHAKGDVAVPTELEKIMLEEAEELIRQKYDHKTGA